MAAQRTEQEQIDVGLRVAEFVKDPAVQDAIARVATQNFSEFKKATSADALRMAAAKATVLDDFLNELQIDIDRGQREQINRTARERREKGTTRPA